jgi:hypothetical protein
MELNVPSKPKMGQSKGKIYLSFIIIDYNNLLVSNLAKWDG